MTSLVLQASGLRKQFGGNHVVAGVDLAVAAGELVALVGPNGAGKTSFLNVVAGQFRPDSGTIKLGGHDVTELHPSSTRRRTLFRSFQNGGAFGKITAIENVAIAGIVRGMGRRQAEDQAVVALERVGMGPVADWPAEQLSGGQRKLIDFARLLLANPSLALLDEPTAGVNPAIMEVMRTIIEERRDEGAAFVIVSHDLPWVFSVCRRVMVLAAGKELATGVPEEIMEDARVREAYLA